MISTLTVQGITKMAISVKQLPLPADCINVIQSFAFVDQVQYKTRLIKKSVNQLMKISDNLYNREIESDDGYCFEWFYDHIQFQARYCKCGDYTNAANGPLNDCCRCKC